MEGPHPHLGPSQLPGVCDSSLCEDHTSLALVHLVIKGITEEKVYNACASTELLCGMIRKEDGSEAIINLHVRRTSSENNFKCSSSHQAHWVFTSGIWSRVSRWRDRDTKRQMINNVTLQDTSFAHLSIWIRNVVQRSLGEIIVSWYFTLCQQFSRLLYYLINSYCIHSRCSIIIWLLV